jgi:hypothetical protein
MYIPVPAIAHAMIAPKGPVAVAKRPGRLKMPAPTIEPMTIAVSEKSESFCALAVATDGAEDAVDDVVFPPLSRKPNQANESISIHRC